MRLEHLLHRLRALGARPCHERLVLRAWTQALPLDSGPRPAADFLPRKLRDALPGLAAELRGLARLRSTHPGRDGSARLLVELADGRTVESVLLPRDGLCVSTQVGCAVGCGFCMTGRDGLDRHLGSAEIVAQVALARSLRTVRKVVFMGMGEPAHNLDNVLDAIELLGSEGAIGHKNLVVSSVGDRRLLERLPLGRVKPALALSLHSTFPAQRASLLPNAPRIDPAELVALGERYARATHYPIQYQWTLLAGVNDTDEELEGIARLLAGKYAVMNFILYNPVAGLSFRRPSPERAAAMALHLYRRGVLAKLRDSAGQDVEGGCGQLRARDPVGPRGDQPSEGDAAPVTTTAVRRSILVALLCSGLAGCAMWPAIGVNLATQGAKGLVALTLGPLADMQERSATDRCALHAAKGISVVESLETTIPADEGEVGTIEPAWWRTEFARDGYPKVERSRTPIEVTLAVTAKSVLFAPPPGAISVRIPYELVQAVDIQGNPDTGEPRAVIVASCSGRFDIVTFRPRQAGSADPAASAALAAQLKARVAAFHTAADN